MKTLRVASVAVGILSLAAAWGGAAEAPPKLAGKWKLSVEASDDPGRKLMEAMRGAGPGGPGGPGGGMRGPGGAGGPGGGMGGGGRGQRPDGGGSGGPGGRGGPRPGGGGPAGFFGGEPPLEGAPRREEREDGQRPEREGPPRDANGPRRGGPLAPSPEFTIDQEGDNLAFRTESNLRLLHSDGQKRKKEGDFGKSEVTARIVKGALVIETRAESGGKRKETYTLETPTRLRIDFELEAGGRDTVRFKLVYDAVADSGF